MSRVEETGAASDWPDRNEPRWTAIALVFASYAIAALAGAAWVPAGSLWLSPIVAAIFGRELGPRRGVSATVGALALTSLGVWLIDREAFEAISRLGLLPSLVASLATSWIAGSIADRWRASEAQQRAAAAALRISTARGDFGHAILRSEDLGDLCQRAANGFVELFGVVAAHVCTVDFVAGTVVEVAVAGRAIHRSRPVELRQSPFADVIANGEILRIDDDEGLLGYSDRPPAVIWASPLQSGSRLFGVVAIGLDQTIAAPLLEALGALGEQIAQLIEKHQTDNALRRSQFAMDHANVGVLLSDPDGKLSYANELACRLVGYRPREILDQTLLGLLAEDQHAEWQNQLDASGGASFSFETELVRSSRHRVPVELTVSQLSYRGENVLCLFARDITDQRATIAALREANERFELVTRGANDGHWDWDLRSDRVHTSPRWKAILGFGEDELAGDADHWIRRIHPQDVSDFRSRLAAHLRGATPHLEVEYRIEHKDGSWIWVLTRGIAVHDESGTAYRIAGSMTETTDRRQREEQLTESVFVDVVTGLANRALFLNRVELAVRRSKRLTSYRFALICLDLDRFKVIVDSLGRNVSDRLLRAIAARLESCVRPGDTVARIGGDEFGILLDEIGDSNDATRIADRILKEMKPAFSLTPHEIYSSVSIGIAFGTDRHRAAEDVLRDADTAMYRAKANGRSRHEIFVTEMHSRAVEQLRLETDLQRAIKREEFCLHYQPIIDLRNSRLIGFEALVRWQHPTKGLLSPHDFVPTAEETGLIVPIGNWVAREACSQLKAWLERYPAFPDLTIAINLSARQFTQPDLVRSFTNLLKDVGVPGRHLRLEITESVLMADVERANALLAELRALDLRVLMDDFGTGYSSLAYLHQFPIDSLKVDRSFVSGNGPSGLSSYQIVRSIVTLAKDLKMDVTAEGVEEPRQLEQLVELGCEFGQGYLFSRPAPPGECEHLLEDPNR